MTVYIYGLLDPVDQKLRYIGKTKNPHSRKANHFKAMANRTVKRGLTARLREWSDALLDKGFEPEFVLLEAAEDNWAEVEISWIETMRLQGHPLLNCFDGGQAGGVQKPKESFRWWHPERGFYEPTSREELTTRLRERLASAPHGTTGKL